MIFIVLFLFVLLLLAVSGWKLFVKAGRQGWEALIPIYNIYVLLIIIRKPVWWLVWFMIPVASFIVGIIINRELARSFGKGVGFTIGLILLPYIFIPILAFGDDVYLLNGNPEGPLQNGALDEGMLKS